MNRLTLGCLLALCATAAHAQTPDWQVTLGTATDSRSKMASKSEGKPFLAGTATATLDAFTFTTAVETVQASTGADYEISTGLGYRRSIAGTDFTFNATHKFQPDADFGTDNTAWEFTADAQRAFGPIKTRLRLQYSPDGTGTTNAWTYVEVQGSLHLTTDLTASAALGRREQDNSLDYTGAHVGVTYALTPRLTADVRYVATDSPDPGPQYADTFVIGFTYTLTDPS